MNSMSDSKITKERYLLLCEAQKIEPDPEVMPRDITDYPPIVGKALEIFNSLRDTYTNSDVPTYTGKDLSALNTLFDIFEVDSNFEKRLLLKLINIFDAAAVKAYAARVKRLRGKQNKASGTKIHS